MELSGDLTFDNIMKILDGESVAESRTRELYAVAQLLELGELTRKQQKLLGEKLVKLVERDHWWRSNGAFNDE